MAVSTTSISNMALARIGATRINDYATDANVQAIQCRLCYEPDRDALLRSHWWPFAGSRVELAQNATDPDFEYDYAYDLPSDYIALRTIWDAIYTGGRLPYSCALEGTQILSDESSLYIRYTKKITDPTKFDPLFVQVLKTRMALDMLYPLCKTAAVAAGDRLQQELDKLMLQVKVMDRAEQNLIRPRRTWLQARRSNVCADPSHM